MTPCNILTILAAATLFAAVDLYIVNLSSYAVVILGAAVWALARKMAGMSGTIAELRDKVERLERGTKRVKS